MRKAECVRLYTDDSGGSHFEEFEIELKPEDIAPPVEPLNIAQFLLVAQSFWLGAPAGTVAALISQ